MLVTRASLVSRTRAKARSSADALLSELGVVVLVVPLLVEVRLAWWWLWWWWLWLEVGLGGLMARRVSAKSQGTMSRSWMSTEGEEPSGMVVLREGGIVSVCVGGGGYY